MDHRDYNHAVAEGHAREAQQYRDAVAKLPRTHELVQVNLEAAAALERTAANYRRKAGDR